MWTELNSLELWMKTCRLQYHWSHAQIISMIFFLSDTNNWIPNLKDHGKYEGVCILCTHLLLFFCSYDLCLLVVTKTSIDFEHEAPIHFKAKHTHICTISLWKKQQLNSMFFYSSPRLIYVSKYVVVAHTKWIHYLVLLWSCGSVEASSSSSSPSFWGMVHTQKCEDEASSLMGLSIYLLQADNPYNRDTGRVVRWCIG